MNSAFSFLTCLVFSILLTACEKNPGACLQINPEKATYSVRENIEIDTRCAADFSYVSYDYGNGTSEMRNTSSGEVISTSYNFTGDYILKVTFYSKSKKKSAFEARRIVVR